MKNKIMVELKIFEGKQKGMPIWTFGYVVHDAIHAKLSLIKVEGRFCSQFLNRA